MKITIALACLLTIVSTATLADIYKYRDKDGNIVFSDQRNPDGKDELVDVSPPNVVPLHTTPAVPGSAGKSAGRVQKKSPQDLYASVSIVSPRADDAVRANDGNVTVRIESNPPLDVVAGDLIRLTLDGQPSAQGISSDVVLENLDRGEHQVLAEIVDIDGQVLKRSEAVKFHVLKHSVLFKKN